MADLDVTAAANPGLEGEAVAPRGRRPAAVEPVTPILWASSHLDVCHHLDCMLNDIQIYPLESDTTSFSPVHGGEVKELFMFDMKNLRRLKKLDQNAPASMKAFWEFEEAAFAEGALTVREKQLMSVAVALTTQCPYCIELHTAAARQAGADDAQLTEAAIVAAAIRAGSAVTHATHLLPD
ncbi:carboxymuconolactone decarboxylase family protein [Streptomyces sp. NPDC005708]|uniref:carboxymuconolactone decarboxylase family protein n=1 Tax=Streptomyces sp. NPDC005708 TaxID=3154564 RepID=UPI0033C55D66